MSNAELLPDNPQLPNDWAPRHYQNDVFEAFNRGLRRQIHIWHRRAGKDTTSLNLTAVESQRVIGTYWHLFPLEKQARKAIWHGIDGDERRIIDHVFPPAIRESTLKTDMMIQFKNGSTWQMAGSDRYNSLVGSNVRGAVFSEWALCDPTSWDYIRPILRENNGWVMFITTYRGKNHAFQMYENLKKHPDWFCTKLTVDDTRRADGSPVLTETDIEAERSEGMSEPMIQQEYYCSPEPSYAGAYYTKQMAELTASKRRGAYGYNPMLPLYAAFDRSTASVLACVLVQPDGNMHNIVGSRTFENTTVQDSFAELRETFPFAKKISTAILPPEASPDHISVPGVEFELCPSESLIDGIDIVRHYLSLTRVDVQLHPWAEEGNNIDLINSLQGYRAESATRSEDMFKRLPEFVPEIFLATAFLHYCVYSFRGGTEDEWSGDIDYTLQDRAAGVHQGGRQSAHRGYRRATQ